MCFAHVGRVLRKGGVLALGDWMLGAGSTTEPLETQRVVRRPDGLVLIFEPLAHYLHGLKDSDFTAITVSPGVASSTHGRFVRMHKPIAIHRALF